MKRKNASLLGNVLMGLGLVVMVVGVGYSILNQYAPVFRTWCSAKYFRRCHTLAGGCPCWRA